VHSVRAGSTHGAFFGERWHDGSNIRLCPTLGMGWFLDRVSTGKSVTRIRKRKATMKLTEAVAPTVHRLST
jgi:hypothetical protein